MSKSRSKKTRDMRPVGCVVSVALRKVPQQDKVAGFHNLITVLNLAQQSTQGRRAAAPITKGHTAITSPNAVLSRPRSPPITKGRGGTVELLLPRRALVARERGWKQSRRHGARMLQP
jgi:hypothetical protein